MSSFQILNSPLVIKIDGRAKIGDTKLLTTCTPQPDLPGVMLQMRSETQGLAFENPAYPFVVPLKLP